jgi:hypothetical protein
MLMFKWLGSDAPHLDRPHLARCGQMLIGCYGGNTGVGAAKNEDAALVLCDDDGAWHFAALCDAHVSSQSAEVVLHALESAAPSIAATLSQPPQLAFPLLHQLIITFFTSEDFRSQCQAAQGETACLLCAQKDQFLWWLSIGDCVLYLLHPELAKLGQFALNQRNFYEWVGHVNTFELAIPCFASGVRELRLGRNHFLMVTDGLLECGDRPFEDSRYLYDRVAGKPVNHDHSQEGRIGQLLERVHSEKGRDSATVIYWSYDSQFAGAYPSG